MTDLGLIFSAVLLKGSDGSLKKKKASQMFGTLLLLSIAVLAAEVIVHDVFGWYSQRVQHL